MDLDLNTSAERLAEQAQTLEAFSSINLRNIRGELSEALGHFGRVGILEEYTKHDITHIDAMLGMYEWMVPQATKDLMTPADWLLTTLATYLHDFGLIVTRDEYDRRGQVEEFQIFQNRILGGDGSSERDYRSQIERLSPEESDRFLYQEFVRYYHAQRIRAWLRETPDPRWGIDHGLAKRLVELFGSVDETFREDVALVCESHHLDDIGDTKKYPLSKPYGRTVEEEANVQYAAMLLRTSDLLHITKDRVPSMAALVVNPRNPKSQVEWAKQGAVRTVRPQSQPRDSETGIQPKPDTVEVHASFRDSEGYFGLTAYLQYASRQLGQTFAWSRQAQANGVSDFEFPWKRIDVSHIEAKGFVAEPFEFSIDQGKILDLLTGHTLYNDTGVVVRELVQNSLDAVRLQGHLHADGGYSPEIKVGWNSRDRVLTVSDNGVGMTQAVVEGNFLRVGSSRYQDPDFRKENPDFSSISRFGIGVLSAFMVADDVSVTTCSETEAQARQLSLRDVHGRYLVRLLDKTDSEVPEHIRTHGTLVSLKLRPSAELTAVAEILSHWVVFPGCSVTLQVDEGVPEPVGFTSVADALRDTLISSSLVRESDGALKTQYGSKVEIRTKIEEGLELAFAVSWSRWLEEWTYIRYDSGRTLGRTSLPAFGVCVGGVRVTTEPPGYAAGGGIASMANATGQGAPLTNVARSALEKTPEYDEFLRRIYSGYASHISDEMRALESERDASLTRAAQEALYLGQELVRAEVESVEIMESVLRTVPAIVIEEDGKRTATTLQELDDVGELASVESATVSSFETVLRSVRGAKSPSLRKMLAALDSAETLPAVPLLCGLPRAGLISRIFTREWEVVKLESDSESRTLRAYWRRVEKDEPIWAPVDFRGDIPSAIAGRLDREATLGRGVGDMSWILLPRRADVDIVGFSQKLAICQGRLLVLPGCEFLRIEALSDEIPESSRNWCIAWMVASMVSVDERSVASGASGGAQWFTNLASGERESSPWLTRVVQTMRDLGILDILAEGSVRDVLGTVDLEPLDVGRWDLRRT